VRDVPVWTKAPLLLRNELVPADRLDGQRIAASGEVKRLGDEPIVISLIAGVARIETAASAEHSDRLLGPHREPVPTPSPLTRRPDAVPAADAHADNRG
jgi:hypothetical protein